jgi:CO/xanthine dehydrogenase Mo-binding subunit
MMGNAVKRAAQDAKKQLLTLAAEKLEVDPDDLEAEGGRVFVKGSPGRGIEIERLAQLSILSKSGPILGKGSYIMPPKPVDRETGQGYETIWMYGAHAVEVKVDRDTGEVTVLRVVAAHDVGKAINPLNCEGQIEGSVVMGMGTSFWEEMVLEGGKVLNANLRDYKIPTALNVPEIFPILVEEKHPEGPYGAKGLGEPALAPTAPAIANAIYDAIGVRIKDLPMTSEKILRALKEQRRNDH